MEGHRPGSYVRMVFHGLPCELVEHFDPKTPILVRCLFAQVPVHGHEH